MSNNPMTDKNRQGDPYKDRRENIQHLTFGTARGILRNMSLNRTELKFHREVKFVQDRFDPLAELASVYNVDLTLFGNNMFFPGQYAYFDPMSIGADPVTAASLGIGGYLQVMKVSSMIEDGDFTTKLKLIWQSNKFTDKGDKKK